MTRCSNLFTHRRVAALLGLALLAVSCSKESPPIEKEATPAAAPAAAPAPSVEPKANQVEVFSWWTGPGEQEGLDAMITDFKAKNP